MKSKLGGMRYVLDLLNTPNEGALEAHWNNNKLMLAYVKYFLKTFYIKDIHIQIVLLNILDNKNF